MAVDLAALKAALVDRATMEAVTKADWTTEDEATKDASVVATQTVWALIDDLEAANALLEAKDDSIESLELANSKLALEVHYLENGDPRIQSSRPARSMGYPRRRGDDRNQATAFPIFGPLET